MDHSTKVRVEEGGTGILSLKGLAAVCVCGPLRKDTILQTIKRPVMAGNRASDAYITIVINWLNRGLSKQPRDM